MLIRRICRPWLLVACVCLSFLHCINADAIGSDAVAAAVATIPSIASPPPLPSSSFLSRLHSRMVQADSQRTTMMLDDEPLLFGADVATAEPVVESSTGSEESSSSSSGVEESSSSSAGESSSSSGSDSSSSSSADAIIIKSSSSTGSSRVIRTKNADDSSSILITVLTVIGVILGVICLERFYSSCRRTIKRRQGREGFSAVVDINPDVVDDQVQLSNMGDDHL